MFSRFPHVFCFLASLRLIVSWFIIMFLSFCFPFPYPFLFGAVYLVVMHAKFLGQFFARLRFICFISLLIVHLWELAAITSFLLRVVFTPLCIAAHFLS